MVEKYKNILSDDEYNHLELLLKSVVVWSFGHVSDYSDNGSKFWYADLMSYDFVTKKMFDKVKTIIGDDYVLRRVYANGQTFGQDGDWHQDCEDGTEHTFLYYFTKNDDHSLIGETYFKIDNKYVCVVPEPNSAVFFNGIILHKGMSPKKEMNDMRISVAFKVRKSKNTKSLL